MSELSDHDLMAAYAATRSEDAAAEIVARFRPMLVKALTDRTRDAEDVVQRTFIRVFVQAAEFDARRFSFISFLLAIARTELRRERRRRRIRLVANMDKRAA
jgi:DNA-directed RNA polymerase specialized sigma24 family protein